MTDIDKITSYLDEVKKRAEEYKGPCPACHRDPCPMLRIDIADSYLADIPKLERALRIAVEWLERTSVTRPILEVIAKELG